MRYYRITSINLHSLEIRKELSSKGVSLENLINNLNSKEERFRDAEEQVTHLIDEVNQAQQKSFSRSMLASSLVGVIARYQKKINVLDELIPKGKLALDKLNSKNDEAAEKFRYWYLAVEALNLSIESATSELDSMTRVNASHSRIIPEKLTYSTKISEIKHLEFDLVNAQHHLLSLTKLTNLNLKKIENLKYIIESSEIKLAELVHEKRELSLQHEEAKKFERLGLQEITQLKNQLHASKEQSAYFKQGTAHLETKLKLERNDLVKLAERYSEVIGEQIRLKRKMNEIKNSLRVNKTNYQLRLAQQAKLKIRGQESQIKNMDAVIKACEGHIDNQARELILEKQDNKLYAERVESLKQELNAMRMALKEAKKTIILKNKILKKLGRENKSLRLSKMKKLSSLSKGIKQTASVVNAPKILSTLIEEGVK